MNVYAGYPLPNAGQVTRELERAQQMQMEQQLKTRPTEPLTNSVEKPSATEQDDTPILVNEIQVTGSRQFPAEVLQSLLADMAGGRHTLSALEAAAGRITAYYRERGYFLASAYVPAQDIFDGVVQIAVLEGMLDQIKLQNSAKVSDAVILAHLDKLNTGEALQQSAIDRQLLLLHGTAGIDKVHASLQGGARAGTSDLLVQTVPAAPYSGRVQLNNHGNRYTGEYQLDAALNINNPLKMGDQLTVRAVGSNSNLLYGRMSYQVPVGGDGLRVGAAYSYSHYQLGRDFKLLDAYGTSETASVFASYPLILSQAGSLFSNLTYENKKLNDRMDSFLVDTDKRVQLVSLGLSGDRPDTVNGGGLTSFDVTMYAGHLNMDAESRLIDAAKANSRGDFVKAGYTVNRLQRITDQDTFSAKLFGQWAGDNLNSSEKVSLGGVYGVRAYPQGEASGDIGNILNLELVHYFTPQLRGMLFYDYGHVKINQNNYSAADNTRTLAGAGLGLNAALDGWQLDSYVAWPIQGGVPLSEPESSVHSPRLWMQMSREF